MKTDSNVKPFVETQSIGVKFFLTFFRNVVMLLQNKNEVLSSIMGYAMSYILFTDANEKQFRKLK
jgi:hypothetical protein